MDILELQLNHLSMPLKFLDMFVHRRDLIVDLLEHVALVRVQIRLSLQRLLVLQHLVELYAQLGDHVGHLVGLLPALQGFGFEAGLQGTA